MSAKNVTLAAKAFRSGIYIHREDLINLLKIRAEEADNEKATEALKDVALEIASVKFG